MPRTALSRRLVREPARAVGAARLPAVTIAPVSTLVPCFCAGCSRRVEARAEMIVSTRDVDTTAAFDVWYCSTGCRASQVSA